MRATLGNHRVKEKEKETVHIQLMNFFSLNYVLFGICSDFVMLRYPNVYRRTIGHKR